MVKARKYILIVEIVILLGACVNFLLARSRDVQISIGGSHVSAGEVFAFESVALPKGTYRIQFDYRAAGSDAFVYARSEVYGIQTRCGNVFLYGDATNTFLTLELGRGFDEVAVYVDNAQSSADVDIVGVSIFRVKDMEKRGLLKALFLCAFLEFIVWMAKQQPGDRIRVFILAIAFSASCYPLMNNQLMEGHDLQFHLLRIEGIASGLSSGVFPVKIHPFWLKNYGCAIGVLYGDWLLYFPALLRCFGFSVQNAYKIFVAFISLVTICISYYSFHRVTGDKNAGVVGAVVYTLGLYRLITVYTRAAVGEYSAMVFLPLIFAGLFEILQEGEAAKKHRIHRVCLVAAGFSGIICSHILSTVIAGIFIFICVLICVRRLSKVRVVIDLGLSALFTVLLSLGFLVPFLDFYRDDFSVQNFWSILYGQYMRDQGVFPTQMFALFGKGNGHTYTSNMGITSEVTITVGSAMLIGLLLFFALLIAGKADIRGRLFKAAALSASLGVLACIMSTCYFPWDFTANEFIMEKISVIQFSWRLLGVASLFLGFVCVYCYLEYRERSEWFRTILAVSVSIMIVNVGWYLYDEVYSQENHLTIYGETEMGDTDAAGSDYTLQGTDSTLIQRGAVRSEGCISSGSYEQRGLFISYSLRMGQDGGWVEFPLSYNRYYTARCKELGQEFEVLPGDNNVVRVKFPADFDGTVNISFSEPYFWRIGEVIPIVVILAGVILGLTNKYRKAGRLRDGEKVK